MNEPVDLFAPDFPHGSIEGYNKGCRGGSCSGVYTLGISCKRAYERYQGDYSFRAAVDGGKTPAEIVAAEEDDTLTSVKPSRSRGKVVDDRLRVAPTVTVADSETPVEDFAEVDDDAPEDGFEVADEVAEGADLSEQSADVDEVKAAAIAYAEQLGIDYEKHGTPKGYYAGCREKEKCPGLERVGKSCNQAVNEYQRDVKARRAAEAAVIAPKGPKPAPPAAAPAAVVEAETERRVDDVLAELHEANRELAETQQTLANVREQAAGYLDLIATGHSELEEARAQLGVLDHALATANTAVADLRDQLAESERAREALSHQLTAATLDSAERASTTLSLAGQPVATLSVDTPPVKPLGFSIEPTSEGGVSVHLQGGSEPVYLDLSFENGQLQRAGVTTGK